jgi:dihydroneopterin aldolase
VTATIELIGLEQYGWHGVLERERGEGQRFLFDVWLDVPDDAAQSDRIEDAVDYREVADAVRTVSDGRAFHLLEALATAVADALVERFPVIRVRVRVRKPDVRVDAGRVEWAAVTVERGAAERGPSRS